MFVISPKDAKAPARKAPQYHHPPEGQWDPGGKQQGPEISFCRHQGCRCMLSTLSPFPPSATARQAHEPVGAPGSWAHNPSVALSVRSEESERTDCQAGYPNGFKTVRIYNRPRLYGR
jgi:hypothetical protein